MIPSTRLTSIGMACGLSLLLAACGSSSSGSSGTAPTLDTSLSSPGLTGTLELGGSNPWVFYEFFSGATSQGIVAGDNPDNLQGITMDGTGATGKITVVPVAGQIPGIYSVTITANDAYGSLANTFVFNLLPQGQFIGEPTVVDFPMNGQTSRSQTIILGTRNGIIAQATQDVVLATLPAPNVTNGIIFGGGATDTTGGITVTQIGASDQSTISANITLCTATPCPTGMLPLTTNTATDNQGNSYSKGILVKLTALPEVSNGYTPVPYTEWFYINPT